MPIIIVYYVTSILVRSDKMNFNPGMPIYLQVVDDIKKQIVLGKFRPGDKLPSSKELAVNYNINPNTAARVYQELEFQGVCVVKRGLGTFVTESEEVIASTRKDMVRKVTDSFITEIRQLGLDYKEMYELIREREVKSDADS